MPQSLKGECWRSAAPAPLEDLEPIFLVLIKGRDDRRAGLVRLVGFRAGRIDFNFKRFAVIASWIKGCRKKCDL